MRVLNRFTLALVCWGIYALAIDYDALRDRMVKEQIQGRGINDVATLRAMSKVPRHLFVPSDRQANAYDDFPLPIGHDQTISQPYIVAFMTEAINPTSTDRILEIGTGSGYQAAVLAEIAKEVYTIEIIEDLAKSAEKRLKSLGYKNIHVRAGDGYQGWKEAAPFDKIMVTAAPDHIPQPLIDQLKVGGNLVIPVGSQATHQELLLMEKSKDGSLSRKQLLPVLFVPLIRGK